MRISDDLACQAHFGTNRWSSRGKHIRAERIVGDSEIHLSVPKGPRTDATVLITINLVQLENLLKQLRARGDT